MRNELRESEFRNISSISSYLYTIGKESIKNECFGVAKECIKLLESFHLLVIDYNHYSIYNSEHIRNIGLEAIESKHTFHLVKDVIKSLYSIGRLQFGYLYDKEKGPELLIDFLNKQYNVDLDKTTDIEFSEDEKTIEVKDKTHLIILKIVGNDEKEKSLLIEGRENQPLKIFTLYDDLEFNYTSAPMKIFKNSITSENTAYCKIPEMLGKICNQILDSTQDIPTGLKIEPLSMAIKSFENFGIMSIHFRKDYSLNKVIIHYLIFMGNFLSERMYSEDGEERKALEDIKFVARDISKSLYQLIINCLKYNFIEFNTFKKIMACIILIENKFPFPSETIKCLENISEIAHKLQLQEIVRLVEEPIKELKDKITDVDEE